MIEIRRVCYKDSNYILAWRNHQSSRIWCFDSNEISFEQHEAWFYNFIKDSKNLGFILEENSIPCGFIRYQPHKFYPNSFTVSILIDPNCRNKGYGSILLERSLHIIKSLPLSYIQLLVAEILENNLISEKLFAKCGFYRVDAGVKNGKSYSEWFLPIYEKLENKPLVIFFIGDKLDELDNSSTNICKLNIKCSHLIDNVNDFGFKGIISDNNFLCNLQNNRFFLFIFDSFISSQQKNSYKKLLDCLKQLFEQIVPEKIFFYVISNAIDNKEGSPLLEFVKDISMLKFSKNQLSLALDIRHFSYENKFRLFKYFLLDVCK